MYAIRHTDTHQWWAGSGWVKSRSDAKWMPKVTAQRAIGVLRRMRKPFPEDTVKLVSIND